MITNCVEINSYIRKNGAIELPAVYLGRRPSGNYSTEGFYHIPQTKETVKVLHVFAPYGDNNGDGRWFYQFVDDSSVEKIIDKLKEKYADFEPRGNSVTIEFWRAEPPQCSIID